MSACVIGGQSSRVRAALLAAAIGGAAPCAGPAAAQTTLVPAGAVWKYLDDGSDQGSAWRDPGFDDSAWAAGPAQLGYGDGDEATVVSYGSDPNNKYITTYFRHAFEVPDPALHPVLILRLLRDDGAVVYINGVEVHRSNMPSGTITYTTRALRAISGAEEDAFQTVGLDGAVLAAGSNLLAVEIHQVSPTSSDISFDLELIGHDASPIVVRGPYLQTATPSSVVVCWETLLPTDGRVWYGDAPDNLTDFVDDPASDRRHAITVGALAPDTRYYYAVGSSGGWVVGGDADHFFATAPLPGSARSWRGWVIGDSGTADANAAAVRDAYLNYTADTPADLWLMLGDNAYSSGTDAEYQAAVFDMYQMVLRSVTLWPTLGNHDARSSDSPTESGPYYDIFELPRNGQAGGLPSGTEAYYSFDYANVHLVCLDSADSDRTPGGAMLSWLQADLDQATADWLIAFWHHPPYTRGSHNSDRRYDSGGRMADMRENALPILEAGGVDLVLSGHSHSYERSYLIDGHYGTSDTFDPGTMLIDGGDGRPDGDGPYLKPPHAPHAGTVYVVAGSSGKTGGGPLNHPVMYFSLNSLGSLLLDISANRLDATFIDHQAQVRDYFTILKQSPCPGDLDGDGDTDQADLGILLADWGCGT